MPALRERVRRLPGEILQHAQSSPPAEPTAAVLKDADD